MPNANEYASSLFQLASEQNALTAYEQALTAVGTAFAEHPRYAAVLHSPAIPLQERLHMLDETFGWLQPPTVLSFLKVMCEKGHIRQINACIEEFERLAQAAKRRQTATVYAAKPLSAAQQDALKQKLCRMTDTDIDLQVVLDESLIGGIKVQLGDTVIDGSIVGRLHSIKGVIEK